MNTTELTRPPAAQRRAASTSASEHGTFGDMLAETVPLVGAIAGYGPPVIFILGPWVLLALMLSGAFAFLVTLIVAMLVAATIAVALPAAIVAAPYLLVRRARSHRARRASSGDHAAQLVPVQSTGAVA